MKTFTSIIMGSLVAALVGCGPDTASSNDPKASQKPALVTPIKDSPPNGIGLATSTDAPPAGVTKGKKK